MFLQIEKNRESYELTFKIAPVKSVITLENKDSKTAICKMKTVTMTCTKK